MESKRYFLLGMLVLGYVQSSFGMMQSSGNQPNNNQPNRQMLPFAFNTPQKLDGTTQEVTEIFTINLMYGCFVRVFRMQVKEDSTLKPESDGASCLNHFSSKTVTSFEFCFPVGTSSNQILSAYFELVQMPLSFLPSWISRANFLVEVLRALTQNSLS